MTSLCSLCCLRSLILTCLLTLVGFVLILAYLDWTLIFRGSDSLSKCTGLKRMLLEVHHSLGFLVVLGAVFQPVLGWLADKWFNPKRAQVRT